MKNQQSEREIRIRSSEKPGSGCDCSKDVILPDTYRDLKKILWFGGELHPEQVYMEGNKAMYEGVLNCSLLFVDEEDKVRSLTLPLEYKGSCPTDGEGDRITPIAIPVLENLSVKALNPRKLGIKAKITPGIKCWSAAASDPAFPDFFTEEDLDRVESQTSTLRYMSPRTIWERDVSLSEDFVLEKNQPSVDEILLCRPTVQTASVRAGDGSVEYKGEAVCEIVYLADDGQIVFCKKTIPISRILDAPGAAGDSSLIAKVYVDSAECSPTEDMNGQYRILSLDLSLDICLICANVAESEYVTDLYSTAYVTENQYSSLAPSSPPRMHDEVISRKITLESPAAAADPVAVYGSARLGTASPKEDSVGQNVVLNLCVLYRDDSGQIQSENLSESFELPIPATSERFGSVCLQSANVKTDGGAPAVACELRISLICFDQQPISAVGQVKGSQSDRITSARPLTVYYPAPGESLWQIAKRYQISRAALEAANRGREPGASMIIPRRQRGII